MMSVVNKTPEIRFKEFTDKWEENILGEQLEYEQPTKYLVESDCYKEEFEIPVLTAGKTFILGYTNETENIFKDNLPVIIFDDFTTATQYVDFPFKAKSSAMKILKGNSSVNMKFIYEALKLINFEVGTHQRHWISEFANFIILSPFLPEQQKIGSFFKSLDKLIAIHKEESSKLNTLKKAMLSKMFPKEGKTVPEIRFKEFTDEWEKKELGKVCDVRDGTHDSPNYKTSGFPLITSKNLLKNGDMDFDNVNYISKEDYDIINQRSKVHIGDILFGMIGTIGNPVIVKKKGFAIKNVALIKSINKIDQQFLLYLMKSNVIEEQFDNNNVGGTLRFIALGVIRSLTVIYPSLSEQQKIGEYFQKLDKLISLSEQKIRHLENLKQAFLQKMFV